MLGREQILHIADKRPLKLLPTTIQLKEQVKEKKEHASAGPNWFHMPAPKMTPELRDDLRLLSFRSALDPARHYKKGYKPGMSRFLQVGEFISDSSSFYSDRSCRKQKLAPTILDSLLRDVEKKHYLKRKYSELEQRSMRNGRRQNKNFRNKPWNAGK